MAGARRTTPEPGAGGGAASTFGIGLRYGLGPRGRSDSFCPLLFFLFSFLARARALQRHGWPMAQRCLVRYGQKRRVGSEAMRHVNNAAAAAAACHAGEALRSASCGGSDC